MPPEFLTNPILSVSGRIPLPPAERPTIKILLYTDDPREIVKGPIGAFGLGLMINQLAAHAPTFANLSVDWISRSSDAFTHADKKLDSILTKDPSYDQIWFFGLHQANKESFTLGIGGGGRESELNEAEVKELGSWMDKGNGVLMTGDHANKRPTDTLPSGPNPPCPDTSGKEFLGLGRALGRCVPRAGLLRNWEGRPTSRPKDSYNTQVLTSGTDVEEVGLQRDKVPQQLILRTFNEKGKPALGGQPHPLFFYKNGRAIQVFPDHTHEGAVVRPQKFDVRVWPEKAIQPKPHVVAYGLDKRNGRRLNILTAYDGDSVSVGRIVADSTWHHYFNVNLENFRSPAVEDSPADQIGQFYGNLAVWLSPRQKRFEMARAMFQWLAYHPLVLEEFGPSPVEHEGDILSIGKAAYRTLSQVASPCEIHELLQAATPEHYREQFEALHFPEKGFNLSSFPSKELMLGYTINWYPRNQDGAVGSSLLDGGQKKAAGDALTNGYELAFERQADKVARTAVFAKDFFEIAHFKTSGSPEKGELKEGFELASSVRQSSERRSAMAACDSIDWDMTLTLDKDPTQSETIGFRNVQIINGVITGYVEDEPGERVSGLTGTCQPFGGAGEPDVSLMTFLFRLKGKNGEVGILMCGVAFQLPGAPRVEFHGKFRAFSPDPSVPAIDKGELEQLVAAEPGDTGTGTGQQT